MLRGLFLVGCGLGRGLGSSRRFQAMDLLVFVLLCLCMVDGERVLGDILLVREEIYLGHYCTVTGRLC